jgi:hypothetical protein
MTLMTLRPYIDDYILNEVVHGLRRRYVEEASQASPNPPAGEERVIAAAAVTTPALSISPPSGADLPLHLQTENGHRRPR